MRVYDIRRKMDCKVTNIYSLNNNIIYMKNLKKIFLTSALISRYKSFVWRLGGMIAVFILSVVLSQASELQLSNGVVVVLGLVMGEITKYLNK